MERIIIELKKKGYPVKIANFVKNGETKAAITFEYKGEKVSPIFYLDSLRDSIMKGASVEEMLDFIETTVQESLSNPAVSSIAEKLNSREFLEKNLSIKLERKGSTNIETAVHQDIESLPGIRAILIVTIAVNQEKGEKGITRITCSHLQNINMSEEEAWTIAMNNVAKNMSIMSFEEMIFRMSGETLPVAPIQLFVITNRETFNGAASILCKEQIKEWFSRRTPSADRLLLIPSSVHEFLACPITKDDDIEEVSAMFNEKILEVNESVSWNEQLGDSVYVLDLKSKKDRLKEHIFENALLDGKFRKLISDLIDLLWSLPMDKTEKLLTLSNLVDAIGIKGEEIEQFIE